MSGADRGNPDVGSLSEADEDPRTGTADMHRDEARPLLMEEKLCAALLAGMVALMFLQALVRNVGPVARTPFATWLAHASEVLPSGLTWLTFLGCGAVTRHRSLLSISLLRDRLGSRARLRLERATWALWGGFFAVLFVLGLFAAYAQRSQMTSIAWLPAWAVSLSIPCGSGLVVWRTLQNLRAGGSEGDGPALRRAEGQAGEAG